jgi:hypothetical protein
MADNNQELEKFLEKLLEKLNEQDSRFGLQNDTLNKLKNILSSSAKDEKTNINLQTNVLTQVKNILKDSEKKDTDFYKAFTNDTKEARLYNDRVEKLLDGMGKDFKTASIEQKKQAIRTVRSAISNIPDSDQKKYFELQLQGYELLSEEQEKYRFSVTRSITGLNNWFKTTNIASTATSAFSQVLNSSSNSFAMLNTAFTTGVQAATTGLGNLATGLAMLAKNPIGMVIATVIQSALQFFSKATTEVFKLLQQETDKLINSFKTLSSAGVTYYNGLEGLRKAVISSGLTMDQFANGVKQNADLIAQSGLGVSEGSKKLSVVLENIRKSVDKSGLSLSQQLLNLGFSFEDQVGLTAETMAQMRRVGRVFRPGDNSEQEIALRTAEYAKNLRIISDITGRDAKQKLEQARQITDNLAFNEKLRNIARERGMSEEETSKFVQGIENNLAKLPDAAAQIVKQQLIYGTAIGDSAKALSQLPVDLQSSISGFTESIRNGGVDLETTTGRVNDALAQFAKDGPGTILGAISAAGQLGSGLSGTADILQSIYTESLPRFKDGIELARQSVEGGAKTENELSRDLREAQRIQQELRIEAEKVATEGIKFFGDTMKATATVIKDAFEFISRKTGTSTYDHELDQIMSGIPGAADGGPIPKGQTTLVGERGPELVVPSQNSMVVPNHFNLEPVIQSMHEQNRIGNEMVRYMKTMVDAQEKLLRASV